MHNSKREFNLKKGRNFKDRAMNKICFPNYQKGLVNLANSLLKHFECPTYHESLASLDKILQAEKAKNVILLVLDGMGTDMLQQNLSATSFLRRHQKEEISSVYPPTTTAATTSIYSGLTPKEHGAAGWQCYFSECGKNVELFLNRDFYTQKPVEINVFKDILPYKKLYEQIREQGIYKAYGVAEPWGDFAVKSFDSICDKIKELTHEEGKKFILSYYKEPDSTMHRTGCYSERTKTVIKSLNDKLEQAIRDWKDSLLIITADHGLLDIKETIKLNEIAELDECLRQPPAIEPRTVAFYIKENKKAQFANLFEQRFKDDYKLMTAEDYIKDGYMGEGQEHPRLRGFLGDYIAVAIGEIMLDYQTKDGVESPKFIAHHAGMTAKEMRVPLITVRTK